jgi:hypothetical protein
MFQKFALYQGTTSVVRKKAGQTKALAPEGWAPKPVKLFLKHALGGLFIQLPLNRMLHQFTACFER